ncbi:MAG: hypothetical protein OXU61_14105 [Gammaproteobacteria bacterium]|nr:hypothetical protein [Gammaproteobacteria bacterium]
MAAHSRAPPRHSGESRNPVNNARASRSFAMPRSQEKEGFRLSPE